MSEVKVNKISPRTAWGTVTMGDSGDAFTIPSGVTITNNGTQVGFGRTGTVDWDTTPKTGTVTAATGSGYFVNTTSGNITVNLPAGAAGSIVAVSDYASTSNTNPITVSPNGSEKINGTNAVYTINTKGLAVTLVYVDSTRGWKSVTGSDADATGLVPLYITGTGGTPCTGAICGNYKMHAFTGPGTFTVSCVGNACGSNTANILIVAGGGSGARSDVGGAGGAGGFRNLCEAVSCGANPIVVGGGGAAIPSGCSIGNNGNAASGFGFTSTGGGAGGLDGGAAGGSGGGGGYDDTGGSGNSPPVSPPQGNDGGDSILPGGGAGGGGGASTAGANGGPSQPNPGSGGAGGNGTDVSPTYGTGYGVSGVFAGGGGGAGDNPAGGAGGTGGPGGGGAGADSPNPAATAGTANSGGGGGGGECNLGASGAGGSGIVIVRYKFQN